MKRFGEQKPMRFDKKELKADLEFGLFVFVGSSCDLFADSVFEKWIIDTLDHCKKFENKYLFQTKNPLRFYDFEGCFPEISYLGTTIETNRIYPPMGKTPPPIERAHTLHHHSYYFPTMVTVEPIMDFDKDILVDYIRMCNPEWVNIGADSQGHNLPEPSGDKIQALIDNLRGSGIEVKLKSNLKRLMK